MHHNAGRVISCVIRPRRICASVGKGRPGGGNQYSDITRFKYHYAKLAVKGKGENKKVELLVLEDSCSRK